MIVKIRHVKTMVFVKIVRIVIPACVLLGTPGGSKFQFNLIIYFLQSLSAIAIVNLIYFIILVVKQTLMNVLPTPVRIMVRVLMARLRFDVSALLVMKVLIVQTRRMNVV